MHRTHLTHAEAERLAYVSGDTVRANLLAAIDDAQLSIDGLETTLDDVKSENESFTKWERYNGPAEAYKQFFEECFQRLAGHYPCPEVTSDYDCSIIFDAIERGEAADAEGGE